LRSFHFTISHTFSSLVVALLLAGCATQPGEHAATSPSGTVNSTAQAGDHPGDVFSGQGENHGATSGSSLANAQPLTAPDISKFHQEGRASWYGHKFAGRRTASGERYNMYAMTAAHRSLPMSSYVRVTNKSSGKSVVVRINDRGPYLGNRIIDLSVAAARALDLQHSGTARVEIQGLSADEAQEARGAVLASGK
jgi:rare lipoprotein A